MPRSTRSWGSCQPIVIDVWSSPRRGPAPRRARCVVSEWRRRILTRTWSDDLTCPMPGPYIRSRDGRRRGGAVSPFVHRLRVAVVGAVWIVSAGLTGCGDGNAPSVTVFEGNIAEVTAIPPAAKSPRESFLPCGRSSKVLLMHKATAGSLTHASTQRMNRGRGGAAPRSIRRATSSFVWS